MEQALRRRRKKHALKQKEVAPLYFNSQLTKPQARLQRPRSRQSTPSLPSPGVRHSRVTFSLSPSPSAFPEVKRDDFSLSPVKVSEPSIATPREAHSLQSILKKSSCNPSGLAYSGPRDSAGCSAPPSRCEHLDYLLRNLSLSKGAELREVITKCRAKTRDFYREMQRQVSVSEEEMQHERTQEEGVRKVLQERGAKLKATAIRKSVQK